MIQRGLGILVLLVTAFGSAAAADEAPVGAVIPSDFDFVTAEQRWRAADVTESGLDLSEIARREVVRDSIRDGLAESLIVWAQRESGWPPNLPAGTSHWIRTRVREGFLLADPRWDGMAKSIRAGLAQADPEGSWTLPGILYLLSRDEAEAAAAWGDHAVVPAGEEGYVAVLSVEAQQEAFGDSVAAIFAGNVLASSSAWPDWVSEPIEEVRIRDWTDRGDFAAASAALDDYGRRYVQGPWFLAAQERLARERGDVAIADSLAWHSLRTYSSGALARRWLEVQVPLEAPVAAFSDTDLEALVNAAEDQRGLTRFLMLSEALASRFPSRKPALDLRAAELGYKTRRYGDLLGAVRSKRIEPAPATRGKWGLVLGRAYRNTGDPDSMAVWFETTVGSGRTADQRTALWEWGRELESGRRFAEAIQVYERFMNNGAGDREEDAWIRLGICRYQLDQFVEADEAFSAVMNSNTAWRRATADFWRYRCRRQLGDDEGARAALERAASAPEGYYSARARSALAVESEIPFTEITGYWRYLAALAQKPELYEIDLRADMATAPTESVPSLTPELLEAADQLWLFRQYGRDSWAEKALSELHNNPAMGSGLDRIERLHALGFPDLAARRALRTSAAGMSYRYPAPYGAAVAAAAERGGLAPEWIWSIMRRESFFEATVVSHAGAVGLMQFMQATATQVAERHRLADRPLQSPVVNLALGTAHLRELVDETNSDWPVILAGYNAGMHNAVRWVHPDDDTDMFIEMIGFYETRNYVKAVLEAFWIYRETLRKGGSAP